MYDDKYMIIYICMMIIYVSYIIIIHIYILSYVYPLTAWKIFLGKNGGNLSQWGTYGYFRQLRDMYMFVFLRTRYNVRQRDSNPLHRKNEKNECSGFDSGCRSLYMALRKTIICICICISLNCLKYP